MKEETGFVVVPIERFGEGLTTSRPWNPERLAVLQLGQAHLLGLQPPQNRTLHQEQLVAAQASMRRGSFGSGGKGFGGGAARGGSGEQVRRPVWLGKDYQLQREPEAAPAVP